ncbi:COR domain-containing protein [Dendronalium sp. ChiSLP03b]|uniref:leucine-rich repeat domain-containing protein n=1 Tax=Dendronalium sp. ChiSLP03b TaxID=3075381 RepID=UPI00391ACAA3
MTNEELPQIIEQAARDKVTTLDLSGKGLTMLPAEIGQLSQLNELDLQNNKLKTLPAEIGQLSQLSKLDLSENRLTTLPTVIGQLSQLSVLDLSNNQLTTLPAEISQLAQLNRLYLGSNQLTTLLAEISQLSQLNRLYLDSNQLTMLPAEIDQLSQLNVVDLSFNQLTMLPTEIGQLTQLSQLYLSFNQLTMLPTEIGQLTQLNRLYLNNNQLTTLPAEIGQLIQLSVLDLSFNQLTTLPTDIGQLTQLSRLNLNNNQLTTLLAEIGQLIQLRVLHLNNNQLTTLPAEISEFTQLRVLHLSFNQLTTLPAEIGQLTQLSELNLNNNQLTMLPPEIQRLSKVRKLDLRGYGNAKLQIPPEIVGHSWENLGESAHILHYYLSLQAEEKKPLNQAKLLLVGQGGVGKTSLLKRLIENSYDPYERKTEGISIKSWKISVKDQLICLNVWDFGGQDIMHATHQFFLTKRSLYLLVLNARDDERQNELEYWLKMIQSFGDDCPIIIVGNKIDEHPLDINEGGLRQKYPAIRHILPVSCKTGQGLENLRSAITNEIAQLNHIHDLLPQSWFQVKIHLEDIKKDYIPYSDYERLCCDKQVTDRLSQSTLIDLLHHLGTVLNFRDDPRLEDTHVLNPEWVTNGVYKILNDNWLMTQYRGILDRAQLKRILNDSRYPDNKQLFIVDMMRKFELCFPLEDGVGDRFLIPDLLPKEQPATGEWEDILAFQYHYNVLPSSVISRFIVRMHQHSDRQTWWRSGIVLKHQGNRALVKSDREDRKIFIAIGGSSTRRELLAMIRSQFYAIHQTIKGLEVKEKVGIPGHPNNIVVDYQTLLEYEKQGLRIIPDGLQESFEPRQLLDGIELTANRQKPHIPNSKPQDIMSDNQQPENNKPSPQNSPAERGIALGMALAVLMLFIFLVIQSGTPGQSVILPLVRLLAAAFAGIIGYLVTGNLGLEAHVPFSKTHIRATGAFAAFIVVLLLFFYGVPTSDNSTPPKRVSYYERLSSYY